MSLPLMVQIDCQGFVTLHNRVTNMANTDKKDQCYQS